MIGFRMPTRVHIAPGSAREVGALCRELGIARPLLVHDPGLGATEWPQRVAAWLRSSGCEATGFDDLEPNPRTTTAERCGAAAQEAGCDGIVALGGGSALDAAKAAAVLARQPGTKAASLAGKEKYQGTPLPLVALPTTCGTGSEVTWVSVLTDPEHRVKISIKGESMFPRLALVDADTLETLPTSWMAATGADALTHALEATTGTAANAVSDALAEQSILLLLEHLPAALDGQRPARAEVMRAATLAGLAFGNADVGAVHCLSESMGGLYDVPHGLANAVLLVPVMASHRPFVDSRLAALERRINPHCAADTADAASAFLERLRVFVQRLEIPQYGALGVPTDDHSAIARAAVANGSNDSNPRVMDEAAYCAILDSLEGEPAGERSQQRGGA